MLRRQSACVSQGSSLTPDGPTAPSTAAYNSQCQLLASQIPQPFFGQIFGPDRSTCIFVLRLDHTTGQDYMYVSGHGANTVAVPNPGDHG